MFTLLRIREPCLNATSEITGETVLCSFLSAYVWAWTVLIQYIMILSSFCTHFLNLLVSRAADQAPHTILLGLKLIVCFILIHTMRDPPYPFAQPLNLMKPSSGMPAVNPTASVNTATEDHDKSPAATTPATRASQRLLPPRVRALRHSPITRRCRHRRCRNNTPHLPRIRIPLRLQVILVLLRPLLHLPCSPQCRRRGRPVLLARPPSVNLRRLM